MPHFFTKEQGDFIRANYVGRSNAELTEMFNEYFSLSLKVQQIKTFKHNRKLNSGLSGRFDKGHIPTNKGTKGLHNVGGNRTSFKPGQKPPNYKPVGSESISKDGYLLVKVSDTGSWYDRWKLKHKLLWEKAKGPIPKGHCLIFLDGDKENITLENLQLITRGQLARLNQNHLIFEDPELTKTGIVIAEIYSKMGVRKKAE